jgi:hypothetical protein
MKSKRPANSGNLTYCLYCGEKLEVHVNENGQGTAVKYCLDCGRGFVAYTGSSYGEIGVYEMTKTKLVSVEFEKLESNDFP